MDLTDLSDGESTGLSRLGLNDIGFWSDVGRFDNEEVPQNQETRSSPGISFSQDILMVNEPSESDRDETDETATNKNRKQIHAARTDSKASVSETSTSTPRLKKLSTALDLSEMYEREGNFGKRSVQISCFLVGTAYVLYMFAVCIGNYGCMLVNLSFFTTSFITYTLSPVYHGLTRSWGEYLLSLVEIVLLCPYIQFGFLIIFDWIKQVGDISDILLEAFTITSDLTKSFMNWLFKKRKTPWKFWTGYVLTYTLVPLLIVVIASLMVTHLIYGWFSLFHLCFWFSYIAFVANGVACLISNSTFWWVEWRVLLVGRRGLEMDDPVSTRGMFCSALSAVIQTKNFHLIGDVLKRKIEINLEKLKKIPALKHAQRLLQLSASIQYVPCFMTISTLSYQLLVTGKDLCSRVSLKRVSTAVFTLLNCVVLGIDIYRATQEATTYFIIAIVLRILFIPTVSCLNPFIIFAKRKENYYEDFVLEKDGGGIDPADVEVEKSRSKSLLLWMKVGIGTTIVVFLIALIAPHAINPDGIGRIKQLPVFDPKKVSTYPAPMFNHSNAAEHVCSSLHGITSSQAVGLAFGAYDVIRNHSVFDNQMGHLFGTDWKSDIDYQVHSTVNGIPYVKYRIKSINKTVISFRGLSTKTEIAMQLGLWASHYLLPLFEDLIPLYDYVADLFFPAYTSTAQSMGFNFYDPNNMLINYITPVIKMCEEEDLTNNENVIFTGVEIGGTIAKVLGMRMHRPAISFMSMQAQNSLYESLLSFEEDASLYISNIYYDRGLFSFEEPGKATNMPVPKISRSQSVYYGFCSMAELCHERDRYWQYCESVIGSEALREIYDYFDGRVYNPFEDL